MSIMVKLEESLRRAWVTVLPEAQTTTVAEVLLRLTSERRGMGDWDWIIDVRNPHVRATPEELDRIAVAFNAGASEQRFTIFISNDPATYERCAIMGRKFVKRRHLMVASVAEAKSLLPSAMLGI